LPAGNFTAAELTNPLDNAEMAVAKYKQAGDSFSPWQTYDEGDYSLQNVAPATGAIPGVSSSGVGSTSSSGTGTTSSTPAQTISAGTSGNPLVDMVEFANNWTGMVPDLEGIVKSLTEGLQAAGQVNHLAAVLIDYPLSMFKPGQAWRMVFWVLTIATAILAYRAFTGHMPQAPEIV
jgi:hypothetical protein